MGNSAFLQNAGELTTVDRDLSTFDLYGCLDVPGLEIHRLHKKGLDQNSGFCRDPGFQSDTHYSGLEPRRAQRITFHFGDNFDSCTFYWIGPKMGVAHSVPSNVVFRVMDEFP